MARTGLISRALSFVEPWYWWGETSILRINTKLPEFLDEAEGPGRQFEVQWLGFHLGVVVGRTPAAASKDEIAARQLVQDELRRVQGRLTAID